MPTRDSLFTALTYAALLGSALMAGTFFAFSAFVMRALGRLPAAQAVAAMQAVNVAVLNPVFLGAFVGTAAASAALGVGAALRWDRAGAGWLAAGAVLYVAGTFGVTAGLNVPLNDRLATVAPDDPDAVRRWAEYAGPWTGWNHVRTAAALAATGAFAAALRCQDGG
ncbi:MAG: hypothetical protein JWO31_2644 [Phycisphaerales bacterium]|nr:hypothetical protein [Phycisphaerales bacterium]